MKQQHQKKRPSAATPIKKAAPIKQTTKNTPFINPGYEMPKWIYGIIVAFCFVCFGSTMFNQYALDDTMVITQNEFVKRGEIGKIFKYDTFMGRYGEQQINLPGGRYRPLSVVSLAIEYQIFTDADTKQIILDKLSEEKDPAGNVIKAKQNDDDAPLLVKTPLPYVNHFMNIMYYAITACLLLLILLCLFPLKSNKGWGLLFNVPVLTVLFFIAHPTHSEVVANIKGRDEIMTLLGALGALWFTLRWVDTNKMKYMAYSFLCFLAGLFSKENATTFLAVIPLTVYFFTNASFKRNFVSMLPLIGAFLIWYAIRAVATDTTKMPETELMNNPFLLMTGAEKWASIIYVLGRYLWLTIWPYPLTTDYYPYHIPIMQFSDIIVIFITLLYIALGIFILWGIIKKNKYAYAAIWYYIPLSIVSNIFVMVGTFMNERFIFISTIGFCMVLADILIYQIPKWIKKEQLYRYAISGFTIVVLFLYAVVAIGRNQAWFDDFTLSTTDVKVSHKSAKSNYDAARVYNIEMQKQQDSTARDSITRCIYKYSHKAVRIHPNYENALLLAAWSSAALNEPPDSAIKFLLQLAGRNPYNPFVLDAMVMNAYRIPDVAQREAIWRHTLQRTPERFESNYYLASVLAKEQRKYEESLPYFEKAIALNPKHVAALVDYGAINSGLGRYLKALDAFTKAVQLAPQDTLALKNLWVTYLNLGDMAKAQLTHERYMQVRQMALQQPQ
ncbi:MAG: tetratricopeptide repeat protein [Prevotellaceae bacterium]|jgi:tetratricopeptide (TPR) repeat protein|nr:tetratricopeptide repeat protein [Prevotellaceae bacterium]